MDRHTPSQRSYNMAQVKSENTKPELYIFSILDKLNIKYEKHYNYFGKPDIAFPEKKIAVFINGEFWHGRHYDKEKDSYKEFWKRKIYNNLLRDRKNYKLLKMNGWRVIKIWDKDIKKHTRREINKILRILGMPLVYKSDL